MASQDLLPTQAFEEVQNSQSTVTELEALGPPASFPSQDSAIGSSLSRQSINEFSDGNYERCNFGDQTHNWTKNDTFVQNQINKKEVHYHGCEGPESKRLKTDNEEGNSKSRTGKIQLLSSISADTTRCLHKIKKIYRGEKKTATGSIPLAVKLLDSSALSKREVENLHKVDRHPNVVRIYDSSIHWEGEIEYVYIAMELCSKETLNDYVKRQGERYDSQLAITHCTQLISGLKYIHEQGICHHDVKPHNILFSLKRDESVSYDKVKMTDFGFSKRFQTEASVTQSTNQGAGTRGYMAPEVLDLREKMEGPEKEVKEEASRKITSKIDVFSIALVLCFCLSKGNHPYGKTTVKQDQKILDGEKPDLSKIHVHEEIEAETKGLLKRMLRRNPEDRPTIEQVWEEWQALTSRLRECGGVEEVGQVELLAKPDSNTFKKIDLKEEAEEIVPRVQRPSIALFETGRGRICSVYSIQPGNEAEEQEIVPLPTSVYSQTHTAVIIGEKLYALTWMKYVFVLDMEKLDEGWKRVSSIEHLHGKYPPAAVFEGKICVCGGGWDWPGVFRKTGESFPLATSTCEVYDPIEGCWQWRRVASMQDERGHNCVVALGKHLYSIGGWNTERMPLKSVERLNTELTN